MFQIYSASSNFCFQNFASCDCVTHLLELKQAVDKTIDMPFILDEYVLCLISLFSALNCAGFSYQQLVSAASDRLSQ